MFLKSVWKWGSVWAMAVLLSGPVVAAAIDLSNATVVVRRGETSPAESTAAKALVEEIERRTSVVWAAEERLPASGPVILLGAISGKARWAERPPRALRNAEVLGQPEAFAIHTDSREDQTRIWILGADGPGVLYGVGHLLRQLDWRPDGTIHLPAPIHIETAPAYPIRGHQLGYRDHSNTYDAFTVERYEQYVRELALFGANAIEQITFQDDRASPHFPLDRRSMNRELSAICAAYEMQYWVWTPAEDLSNPEIYARHIAEHEQLYADCPRLDAVFFPGGDPGNNPPALFLPFLEDLAERLARTHPAARIWVSLQGFSDAHAEEVYSYIDEVQPPWLGGLVAGPSSPPIVETRARLHPDYGIRHYPDITHTVRAQYPTPWWDPAFNVTLGREPTNPEPIRYSLIHNHFAPYTVGSISYSDGVNDDLNKAVWSRLGWDPELSVTTILEEYGRFFYGGIVAERSADALLALEQNWRGPLATNGAVEATLALWRQLDGLDATLSENWRWLLHLQRAEYDAYTRRRLHFEQGLEAEANATLRAQAATNPDAAIDRALAVLERAETDAPNADQRERIIAQGDELFRLIGIQQSVERHQASGTQRGCVLDLLDHPLFNRWWMADQFAEIRALDNKAEKVERLLLVANWESPGAGSFYDDVGNIGNMPRRVEGEQVKTDPLLERNPNTGFMWWDDGQSRTRPSWQSYTSQTTGLRYEGLDPEATYTLRATGYGAPIVMADGEVLVAREEGRREIGEFMHFEIPRNLYADGLLIVTWAQPDEGHLNWRQHSRLTEVWLLRAED